MFSDELTGLSSFAPTASEQAPASLSTYFCVNSPSGKPTRTGLHPVPRAVTRYCDPDHIRQPKTEPRLSVYISIEGADQSMGESSQLGRAR